LTLPIIGVIFGNKYHANYIEWKGRRSMALKRDNPASYQGFEQGPIRPPSEAFSLLIRATRNCPWNHCRFCSVYKDAKFSIRPVDDVKRDIDEVCRHVTNILKFTDSSGRISQADIRKAAEHVQPWDFDAFSAAYNWVASGMKSVFLQDANSLILKPAHLVEILNHLKMRFPFIERVTSYARSHTVAGINDEDLAAIRGAGLNRIHIGLESGSDEVLRLMKKGVSKQDHVKAGQKAKKAGMELSEYVMPGLGGKALSEVHARETADALNRINPDFIRLRSLTVGNGIPVYEDVQAGRFEKATDLLMIQEIYLFIQGLHGIRSRIVSDHMMNLLQEVEGNLPEDQGKMLGILQGYLDMDPEKQCLYQVGRRLGFFSSVSDMDDPGLLSRAVQRRDKLGITPGNVDQVLGDVLARFVRL